MVTVYVLIVSVSMFLFVTMIDVFLYGRSYWNILDYIFDVDLGTKEYYVIGAFIIGLMFSVGTDLRPKRK